MLANKKEVKIFYVLDLLTTNNYFFELLTESEIYPTSDIFGNND